MADTKLTAKREAFARAIASGMTQADAYRECFSTKNMKPQTIWEEASRVAQNPEVSARIEAIKAEIAAATVEKTALTREDIIEELEAARVVAMVGSTNPQTGAQNPQASAAVAASMGKAKLLGMVTYKVEHKGAIGVLDVADGLTEAQKIAAAKAILRAVGYEFED